MSDIRLERNHGFGEEEALRRVAEIEPRLEEWFGVTLSWNGARARLTGRGLSGTIRVTADRIAVELKLGLLLRPLGRRIREGIATQLDRALAARP